MLCPNASVLELREWDTIGEETAQIEFECLGLTDNVLNPAQPAPPIFVGFDYRLPTRMRVAFFGTAGSAANPTLPFQNLQILDLSGNVNVQQFTLSSTILPSISISQNKTITTIGLANLPKLEGIKLYRCPSLRTVKATLIKSLKVLDITA